MEGQGNGRDGGRRKEEGEVGARTRSGGKEREEKGMGVDPTKFGRKSTPL